MMYFKKILWLILASTGASALCLAFGEIAIAQTVNDIESAVTQGAQFDKAQELTDRRRQQVEGGDVLEGEPGVFILRKIDIFSVGALLGGGYSTNPNRNFDTNGDGSFFASMAVSAGVNTRIASKYEAGINIIASGVEYEKAGAPSNRNLVANAYVGRSFMEGKLYVSANASTGLAMDSKFKDGTMYYRLALSASTFFSLSDNVIIRPGIATSRQWSGQSEQNNIAATISSEIIWRPAARWLVSGLASYTYRKYDDFYEDVTFVTRKDNVFHLSVSVVKPITDMISVSASAEYTHQGSKFFLSEYNSLDGGIYGRITHRF